MNPSTRATEVWRRLTGMFGGDAIERKYGEQAPPEWVAMLGRLNDFEIDRGLRRLVYSGKAYVPTLPEFVRLARAVRHDDIDEPQPARFLLPSFVGDRWDIAGNRHLMAHIMRTMREHPARYGEPCRPSQQMSEATAILIGYKKAWSRDMREWDGAPTAAEQKRAWTDCIRLAEAEIEARLGAAKMDRAPGAT